MNYKKLLKKFHDHDYQGVINALDKKALRAISFPEAQLLGSSYSKLRDWNKAFDAYQIAYKKKPHDPILVNNLSEVMIKLNKQNKALELWSKLSNQDKMRFSVNYGQALYANGLIEKALEVYLTSLINRTFTPTSQQILSEIYLQTPNLFSEKLLDHWMNSTTYKTEKSIVVKTHELIWSFINSDGKNVLDCLSILGTEAALKNYRKLNETEQVFVAAYVKFVAQLSKTRAFHRSNASPIFHIGDSHSLSFCGKLITINSIDHIFSSKLVIGLKAFHLGNKELNKYQATLRNLFSFCGERAKIVVSCGEIDCRENEGFIKHKDVQPILENVKITTSRYVEFVEKIKSKQQQIVILSVHQPIQQSSETLSQYNDRVSMVKQFNNELKNACEGKEISFVDVNQYLPQTKNDHFIDNRHLGPNAFEFLENTFQEAFS